ncbi:MAG: helix-turn-helix transcriptional regulator, partial [Desulfobacterales bacterium]
LERNLVDVMSPFLYGMALGSLRFTPAEIQIINLLREGLSTRQMANFLDLSPRTVESYRDNIRKKLGIKNTKTNLRTYLMAKGKTISRSPDIHQTTIENTE